MQPRDQQKFLASRKIVRFMYIIRGKGSRKDTTVKISLLTTEGEYNEYSMRFHQKQLSPYVIEKLKSFFQEYLLVHDTEILASDGIEQSDLIYVYLSLIHQHVNFLLNSKSTDDVLRRICKYHRNITKSDLMRVNKNYLNKVWDFLLRRNRCPWITQYLDYQLQRISSKRQKREIKMLRVGMYYMFIKKKYREINDRAKAKKIALQDAAKMV